MRTKLCTALAIAAAVVAAPLDAGAQKNAAPVTIEAKPNPTVFSTPITVTGAVKGAKGGVGVTLQRRPATGGAFATVGTSTTDTKGRYTFGNRPRVNVVYRVTAATQPPQTSPELLVRVAMLVGFRVSDATPRRGQLVRFSGIVRPPHNGRSASIQRKAPDGRWVTIRRATLERLDSTSSRYGTRLRVRATGEYRVRVVGHADHAQGISRARTLTVG